ncbi:DUF1801 domain-containing protein [Vagococcus fluvialis]|uniref:DUF1801 domain-containing protein n=1 Tax=Vagococcus fluvialis TaxID=2738 RepID=UPI003B223C48
MDNTKVTLDQNFNNIAKNYTPEIQILDNDTRDLIYSVLPSVIEVIWEKQKTIGYGISPKKMSGHFCYIAFNKEHVTLGFNYGSELEDSTNLLEGVGKLMRHVKIKNQDILSSKPLRELLIYASSYRVTK